MRRLPSLLLVLALAGRLAAADAPDPEIRQLKATAAAGHVSVSFQLASAFRNGETLEALESGLPTTFTYFVELYRDRPNWFDDSLRTVRLEVICTYNSLTREYLVNYRRDRHLVRSETFTDPVAVERRMTQIDEPDLFDVGSRKAYKLRVRARASLARGWLMYVIPWEAGTRWSEARVRVAEPAS